MSCPGALRRAPALSVSGPDALCVGARRSLTLFVGSLGPRRALCRGPAFSESGPGALSRRGPALCASSPGTLCRTRRSVARIGPRRSLSGPGALSLSVSGPGALCGLPTLPRRFLCPSLALSRSLCRDLCRGLALSRSLRPRRSLCRLSVRALSLSLCRDLCWVPAAAPFRRCLCRVPALIGSSCVSARPSLCRSPALFVLGPGAHLALPGAPGALCVGPHRSVPRPAVFMRMSPISGCYPSGPQLRSACHTLTQPTCHPSGPGPQLRSACHPSTLQPACHIRPAPTSDPRASYWVCEPSPRCACKLLGLRAPSSDPRASYWVCGPPAPIRSACHRSSPARSLFPGENPKPYLRFGVKRCYEYQY